MSGDDYIDLRTMGHRLRILRIELYPAAYVSEWRGLVSKAQQQLGGVRTGIGVIGSAEWVAGASLALGALEGVASAITAKDGVSTLRRAERALGDALRGGRFFTPVEIEQLHVPDPAAWRAAHEGEAFGTLGNDFFVAEVEGEGAVHIRWAFVSTYAARRGGEPVRVPAARVIEDEAAYFLG